MSARCAAGSREGISLATARTSPNVNESSERTNRAQISAARRRLRTRRRRRGIPFSLQTRKGKSLGALTRCCARGRAKDLKRVRFAAAVAPRPHLRALGRHDRLALGSRYTALLEGDGDDVAGVDGAFER